MVLLPNLDSDTWLRVGLWHPRGKYTPYLFALLIADRLQQLQQQRQQQQQKRAVSIANDTKVLPVFCIWNFFWKKLNFMSLTYAVTIFFK